MQTDIQQSERPAGLARPGSSTLAEYIQRQENWSGKTFGHGVRTKGITAHIRKELAEIEAAPHDVEEWIDVVILALDGAWRAGYSPEQICDALDAKQAKNFLRTYPMPLSDDHPSEHIREVSNDQRSATGPAGGTNNTAAQPGRFDAAHGSASSPELSKPPLGCRPRWIAEEMRLMEVASAVSRYMDAGKPVPLEWVDELIHHIGNMGHWRAWKYRAAMTPNGADQRPGHTGGSDCK